MERMKIEMMLKAGKRGMMPRMRGSTCSLTSVIPATANGLADREP